MYFHASDSFPYMSTAGPAPPFHTHPHSLGSQCASVCGSSPQHSVQSVAFIRGVSHLDKVAESAGESGTDLELRLPHRNDWAVFVLRGV